MATTTELLSSAHSVLESHAQLMKSIEMNHSRRRELVSQLPPFVTAGVTLPDLPTRSPSPDLPPGDNTLRNTRGDYLERERERQLQRTDLDKDKMAKVRRYRNYVPEEETIRNDYSQQCVDGGQWPQNWVLGAELEQRFEEYPKQQRLLALKQAAVNAQAHPPTHLPLSSLPYLHPTKFDVILIDPPYAAASETSQIPSHTGGDEAATSSHDISYGGGIDWDQIASLPIPSLSADPSFIFLWVGHGNSDGLERGREVLAKWGFRRCEDIVWVKTNRRSNRGPGTDPPPIGGIMTRTTEHCLMGIRGTVRRSSDGWFVHCNIDTDVIIWEGDPTDPLRKPPELHALIENFCLGTRRLEIFGRASSLRRGWVTAGDIDDAAFELEKVGGRIWERESYEEEVGRMRDAATGKCVVATSPEIEILRPKSPNRPDKKMGPQQNQNQHHQQQHHQSNMNANHQMQMRMGPPMGMGNPVMGGGFNNNPGPMMGMQGGGNINMGMQGGGMGMNIQGGGMGPIPGSGFGGPIPSMGVANQRGFEQQPYPQMSMGMGPGNIPMRPAQVAHINSNMGMTLGPVMAGGGMGVVGNPVGLPQNAPIRLGGGPMQAMAMHNPMAPALNMGMMSGMNMGTGVVPMRVGGGMSQQQPGMGMMNNNNGVGMGPMQGQSIGASHGIMGSNMQIGGPQMQMGGMGMVMGPRIGSVGHPQFPNAGNANWQNNQQQQGGNWNQNGGYGP